MLDWTGLNTQSSLNTTTVSLPILEVNILDSIEGIDVGGTTGPTAEG